MMFLTSFQIWMGVFAIISRSSSSINRNALINSNLKSQTEQIAIPSGAYIHIPFCRRRCFYCDFPIKVVGDRPSTQSKESSAYTDILLREMKATIPDQCNYKSYLLNGHTSSLETIYFGGGTPSLLDTQDMHRILTELDHRLGVSKDAEISMEIDPGTIDLFKMKELKRLGVNRVSLGVQSFDDVILKTCGRAHSRDDIFKAVEVVKTAGIDNFSIDLISSLPGMTLTSWQIEDGTHFGKWYTPGQFPLPSEESAAAMYSLAMDVLTKQGGYEHYEVSNYCQPDRRSKHNQKYWNCESVWGFGLGSAGFVGGTRYSHPKTMEGYAQWVTKLEDVGFLTVKQSSTIANDSEDPISDYDFFLTDFEIPPEIESVQLQLDDDVGLFQNYVSDIDPLEYFMLRLRTADGFNMEKIRAMYGDELLAKVVESLKPFAARQLVRIDYECGTISLTDPQGFLISNDIISSVFAAIS